MSRRPFSDPILATQATPRRRPGHTSKRERLIRRLLLGALLLTQAFPFLGSTRLGYGLLVAVVLAAQW